MAAGKRRQANFELLRMLAMLMVVTMHFLSHTGGRKWADGKNSGGHPD